MRCRIFMLLMLCGVLATGLRAASAPSARKTPAQVKGAAGAATPERARSWSAKGWGQSSEDAYQVALDKAREQVIAYLDRQNPPLDWTPSLDDIAKLVTKRTAEEPTKEQRAIGVTDQVRLDVVLTADQFRDMREQDRRYRQKAHLFLLGKFLAAVVAGLAALACYLRLDSATKGYYTTWLRLAAVGFAAAIAAGAWLLPFLKGRLAQ